MPLWPRPKWVDDAVLGKKELESIKSIVGASASRKRATLRAYRHEAGSRSTTIEARDSTSHTPNESLVTVSDDHEAPSHDTLIPINEAPLLPHQPKWFEDHEASLMMDYLDHVFFIQFRFYTPSISAGGRGWLLSLLTETKPLYHAALSLSACLAQETGEGKTDYLQQLGRHHNLTLKELQLFIQAHSKHDSTARAFGGNVHILACMVQLISFELFHGGMSTWQVHLRAASELVLLLHGLSENHKSESPITSHKQTLALEVPANPAPFSFWNSPDEAALKFFTGAIIWFNALACVSTRLRPYLSRYYNRLLSPEQSIDNAKAKGTIELQTIMGCQNWAMELIGGIAELSAWKESSIRSGRFDIHHLAETARTIESALESDYYKVWQEIQSLRDRHSGAPPHHRTELYNRYTTLIVTTIFACAALIYLQTVVSSDPSILNVQATLQNIMSAMSLIPDPRMFRGLVWPICIAGCMASSPEHQYFFKNTVKGAIDDSPRSGNSFQALRILEKSWEMQQTRGLLIDCATVIQDLRTCILLV